MYNIRRVVVPLTVGIVALMALAVAPLRAEIDTIFVLPQNPIPGNEVTLVVEGALYDLCWEVSGHSLSSNGDLFSIEIEATDAWTPGWSCLQALEPYSVSYELGFLPAGTYAVRVVERDASLRSPGVHERHACFSVGGAAYACDCNCYSDPGCNGATDVTDVVRVIGLAFRGAIPDNFALCPWDEMDVDCSGLTDILDVIGVVDVAFRGAASSSFCDPCAQ
jgi:hypothetical protein